MRKGQKLCFGPLCFPVALQKRLAVLTVAKRFGAASAAGGEASAHIAVIKAVLKAGSTNELMQEASVEAVARPDGIYGLNGKRSRMKAVFATFGECALRPALDDNYRKKPRQNFERGMNVAGT